MFATVAKARAIQERIYAAATCCEGTRAVSPGFVQKYAQSMWKNFEQPESIEAHGLFAELDVVFRLLQSFDKSAVYWNIFMNSKQGYSVVEFDFFIIVPEGVLLLEVKNFSQNAEWRAGASVDTWEKVFCGRVVETLPDPFKQIRRAKERLGNLLSNYLRLPPEVKVGRVLVTPNIYIPVTDDNIKVVSPGTMCEAINEDRAKMRSKRTVNPTHLIKIMSCVAREGVFPDFYDPGMLADMAATAGNAYCAETVQSISPLVVPEPNTRFGFVSYGSIKRDTQATIAGRAKDASLYHAQFTKALAAVDGTGTFSQYNHPISWGVFP